MRDAALDLLEAVESVPEHLPLLLLDAAVGLGVIEDVDLVVVARTPEQLRRLLAHHVPHRAAEALALRVVEHGELVQIHRALALGEDHRGAVVLAHVGPQQRRAFEVVGREFAAEARFDQRLQAREIELRPVGHAHHLFAAAHQRARALVREQFLGQIGRSRDRHRGRHRQAFEQILDLLDLDLHAAVDPRLLDQMVVFGRQVDRIDDLAPGIEQAAGAGEEDDLVGLQFAHQLVGGEIGIDVEDLARCGFAQARDHRNRAGLQARLDRREVHAAHLADQAVGVLVEIRRFEHAAGDRRRARTVALQGFDQAQVRRLEHATHDGEAFGRGHAQAVDRLLLDARGGEFGIQLRAGAVQHDRGEADFLQERQRGRQIVELVTQHRAADLDHGETLGVELRETLEVLADLLRAGHAREQAHDGLTGLDVGRGNVHGLQSVGRGVTR